MNIQPVKDKYEVLSKVLPSLLGAFFSGIVAIIIFYITKLKEEFSKKNQSKMFLEIIESEIETNLNSVSELSEIIITTEPTKLVDLLEQGSIQEQFIVLSSNLSTEVIDKFLIQLNKEDYSNIATKCKKFKSLIHSLDMLNDKITDKDNKVLLINRLKILFEFFTTEKNLPEKENNSFLKRNSNLIFIGFSFIIINTIINIILIKFL